jgi:hypothetical protein
MLDLTPLETSLLLNNLKRSDALPSLAEDSSLVRSLATGRSP